jgi:hypothetical protein
LQALDHDLIAEEFRIAALRRPVETSYLLQGLKQRMPPEKAVALPRRSRYIPPVRKPNMRAETEKLVEDIKRSIGLLRRHL